MIEQAKNCQIAIIGGGLSGLIAAYLLHEANIDVQIFEAAGRLGGRIDSLRDISSGQAIADLGPTWVWPPYQTSTSDWLKRLGLDLFPQYETGNAIFDAGPDQQPQHRFLPGQHGLARIIGGPQSIVDALSDRLPQSLVNLRYALTGISQTRDQFQLQFDGRAQQIICAERIIIAAPLRLMAQNVSWVGLLNASTLAIMQTAPTWMSSQAKASIVYKHPFWRERGLSGRLASQAGPLSEAHDHTSFDEKHAALFGFIGWPVNVRQSQDLSRAIIDQLTRCFGAQAAQIDQMIIKDWAEDKNICSQLDLRQAGEHPQVLSSTMRQCFCQHRLVFAVAETAAQHPGLIDGAFESGARAAKLMLAEYS